MPEIMDGRNIADFVDADILRKLHDLEVEENQLLQEEALEMGEDMVLSFDTAPLVETQSRTSEPMDADVGCCYGGFLRGGCRLRLWTLMPTCKKQLASFESEKSLPR